MKDFNYYLEKVYAESGFCGKKETEHENCNKCQHASFYSPDGEKRDFPACKMYGLGKGSWMNCEDFEPSENN